MQGHVSILSVSPEAAAMIASGGRISTMDGTADEIYANSLSAGQEKNEKLIGKVLSSGHTSVLEHCYVNLSFENVSVLAEQFLIEFRLASFTVKSRRYVDFSKAGYVSPVFTDNVQMAIFERTVESLFGTYDVLEAAGVPKEDARFVLPYCFCSNFFCSMNARELVHVMNELAYGRGSRIPELRALGESLFAQCEQQIPFLAVRKPEAYRQPDAFCLRQVQLLTSKAPVTVLAAPQDAEGLICGAYQLARGNVPQPLTKPEQTALLKALLAQPRKRELEQASYTLLFGGLSLAALTHLTRHRMQALCAPNLLKSARYDRYVLPESVQQTGLEAQYREAFRAGWRSCCTASRCRSGGGCAVLPAAQRPDSSRADDYERRRTICLFPPALLQSRPVGDPRRSLRRTCGAAENIASALQPLWPELLRFWEVPGGKNDLRKTS